MSIASEIQDLQTNLQAAKSAVATKGGTVADTGLAGLASEIASIPTGGGPLASYGSITYIDSNNTEQTLDLATEEDFLELCTSTIDTATIIINNHSIVKSSVTNVTIADGVTFLPDYFCYNFYNDNLTVVLPSSITIISGFFLSNTRFKNELNLQNVKYIGTQSLNARFNSRVILPNIEFIGTNFLYNNSTFNSAITLNDNCRFIDSSFMSGCSTFNQSFTLPSKLEYCGTSFMRNCNNFTGTLVCNGPTTSSIIPTDNNSLATSSASAAMYTTGVTLTGPYAQNWKDALPDRTSSSYRKLIVGS